MTIIITNNNIVVAVNDNRAVQKGGMEGGERVGKGSCYTADNIHSPRKVKRGTCCSVNEIENSKSERRDGDRIGNRKKEKQTKNTGV